MDWVFGLALITAILVFGIDMSGFISEVENYLTVLMKSPIPLSIPKPFSCSKCAVFWVGLIYLLVVGKLSLLSVFVLSMFSLSTPIYLHLMSSAFEFVQKLLDWFDNATGLYD